jgi:hypothetical protein
MSNNLYNLACFAGLRKGTEVLIDGPHDTMGDIQSSLGPSGVINQTGEIDCRFAERYLIRGKGRGPRITTAPFAAN